MQHVLRRTTVGDDYIRPRGDVYKYDILDTRVSLVHTHGDRESMRVHLPVSPFVFYAN